MSSQQDPVADLSAQKRALFAIRDLRARLEAVEQARREPIAIVGMACRFPGAPDLDELLAPARAGTATRSTAVPPDRWDVDDVLRPGSDAPGKTYSREGGFIDRRRRVRRRVLRHLAARGVSMDPQQRLLLEVAWEALEHAGHRAGRARRHRRPACSSGSRRTTTRGSRVHHPRPRAASTPTSGTGGAACVAAGGSPIVLGLHGPAMAVDTACSSSLVAVAPRVSAACARASATWRWPAAST